MPFKAKIRLTVNSVCLLRIKIWILYVTYYLTIKISTITLTKKKKNLQVKSSQVIKV